MSNNKGQKVPRKSKLIPREYLDDVQDDIQMQANDKESVLRQDPDPISDTSSCRVPALVEEVEEFVEKPSNDTTIKDFDAEEALAAVIVIKQEMRDFDKSIKSDKTTSVSKKKDYSRCPRPKLPISKRDSKSADIRICKLDPKVVFEELENLAKITTSLADKILDIEIRNTWGRYLYEESEESIVNLFIFNSLEEWQSWCGVSANRESPLMYKCYICKKAWWYLQPLRDHIDTYHKDGNIKLHLELCGHECNLIISYNAGAPTPKTFVIDDPCWKCENNAFFHNNSKNISYYQCKYCEHYNSTCRQLNDHLAICPKYMTHLKGENQEHIELFKCHICGTIKVTINDLKEHYSNCHTVRSDVPSGFRVKQCDFCNQRYVHISFHWCPKKKFHSLCTICMRRFPSKLIAFLHKTNSAVNYKCRVCEKILSNQCQEVKHMAISHSENFLILPKCLTCVEHVVFSHDICRNTHVAARHKKKNDKRLYGLEIVVPKICVSFDFEKFDSTSDDGDELSNTVAMSQNDNTAKQEFSNNDYCVSQIIIKEVYSNFIEETDGETVISKRPQIKYSAEASTTKDVKPMTFRYIFGNKYGHESTNSVEEENDLDVNTSIPEVQPTTNPVFYASQKVFPAIVNSEPLDTEELNENIVIKNEIIDEEETRVNEHTSLNEYISVKKDISVSDSEHVRVNENTSVNIDHKKLDYEDLLARMFGMKKTVTGTSTIKHEPEEEIFAEEIDEDEQFVDDLIICNSQDNTNEVSDKDDDDESVEMSDYTLSSSDDEVLKNSKVCKKCKFVGNKVDFKYHLEFCSVPIKCTKCNHKYATIKSYVKHFHEKHKYARNTCPDCENVLPNNCTFVNHIKSHVHQSFSKVRNLKTTDKKKKIMGMNECTKCKKNVVDKSLFGHWEAHLIVANRTSQLKNTPSTSSSGENEGEKIEVNKTEQFRAKVLSEAAVKDLIDRLIRKPEPYRKGKSTCSVCKKSLVRTHDFRRHLIEHLLTNALHNFERYNCLKCQACAAKFWKSDDYKQHMREHACLPLYKCEVCDKTFSDSSNFAKHKKIHNLDTIDCVVCKKKFRHVGQLKKHAQLHDTVGPIKCDCCNEVFLDGAIYRRHQRIVQRKQNPVFHCRICKTKFTSIRMKWDHQWEVHKVREHQADCPLCFRPFRKFTDVKQHIYKFHRKEMKIREIKKLYEQAISKSNRRKN